MIALLAPGDSGPFPDVRQALRHPNGLLAAGGDLSPQRLVRAYRHGIFPWFSDDDPILWWSPDPRTVLFPDRLRCSRSLRKRLRQRPFGVTLDRDFAAVIQACAAPRDGAHGTWILPEMVAAYSTLHRLGIAHSVEVWDAGRLVGGLYGVACGQTFFGESMFSRVTDASKVALVHLCRELVDRGFRLIDCQMRTAHLSSLGAVELPRDQFVAWLDRDGGSLGTTGSWDDGGLYYPADQVTGTLADGAPEGPGPASLDGPV
ncbi:MAG TPA: leucyl/phenylalanyl-tRNA--protein transferase [Lamprocystis sp. (in: g-proteobacteria)]|nr:leucyl/phenylalanyl-tRNA--protein transferase [Lamprocystis sp. (in: g-proteobacteria)]